MVSVNVRLVSGLRRGILGTMMSSSSSSTERSGKRWWRNKALPMVLLMSARATYGSAWEIYLQDISFWEVFARAVASNKRFASPWATKSMLSGWPTLCKIVSIIGRYKIGLKTSWQLWFSNKPPHCFTQSSRSRKSVEVSASLLNNVWARLKISSHWYGYRTASMINDSIIGQNATTKLVVETWARLGMY